ncbi:hypothetical protein HF324_17685 [Chitinophaga oryzae]|uniref:Uncharacterized protein n=1 Tax=Chitinophaga oryzae TaxID=2725414 RepID=A0AAE6ZI77_9BACT|nr:hypothetical protein [Chitinophaga oryzae]QJB33116.1 hypothetical protein HF329_18045 [Chitinophaga oryzae]QJB39591.1 hypothetical protein HF324_17685 [Chitinophaga oryzae]
MKRPGNKMKSAAAYYEMSLLAAAHFNVQPFLSDYVMVHTLFPLCHETAAGYMDSGALRRLLLNTLGQFQVLPEKNQLLLTFDNGYTLAHFNSDLTWTEFFSGGCVAFEGPMLSRIRAQYKDWGLTENAA